MTLALTSVAVTTLLAAEATDASSNLLTYGPLGIIVVLFLFGQIVAGPTHKRALDEIDRLNKLIDEKVYPTVEANARATEQLLQQFSGPPTRRPTPRKKSP